LLCHQWLLIATGHNLAIQDAMDGLDMLVGNLSATDERDPQDARGW
jgi:hypothetical protein